MYARYEVSMIKTVARSVHRENANDDCNNDEQFMITQALLAFVSNEPVLAVSYTNC